VGISDYRGLSGMIPHGKYGIIKAKTVEERRRTRIKREYAPTTCAREASIPLAENQIAKMSDGNGIK
jgi:hypothetical protein